MPITFKAATRSEDKELVYRLRHQVFVEEENRFSSADHHVLDMYDCFAETVNILAFKDDTPIGTIRMTAENAVGIPAYEFFDFSDYIRLLKEPIACIGWLCIAHEYRKHPGLLMGLFKMAVREVRKAGCRHVMATLHPPLFRMLQRSFGAKPVGPEFHAKGLDVSMVPAHIDVENFPAGVRESFNDPSQIIFEESNKRRIYQYDETIVKEGEPGHEAFLIMRGAIRIIPNLLSQKGIRPGKTECAPMGKGDIVFGQGEIFGELSLLDRGVRTTTVVPYSDEVDLMVWSQEEFYSQLESNRNKSLEICTLLGKRLRNQIQGVLPAPDETLILRILLGKSEDGRKTVDADWLARQSGIWRNDLDRMIQKWMMEKLIASTPEAKLCVLDASGLLKAMAA